MTPAEELRAAATALRCEHAWSVANVAPPGPCEKCGIPYSDFPVVAEHLAVPLAAWLDGEGKYAARVTDPRNQEIIADQDALGVARAIRGGVS